MKQVIQRVIVAGALAACMAASWALPSVQEVQAQVQAGRYEQAEQAMAEVVAAKPGSGKAHYLYAEILAHNGRFAQAAEQARLARQADPQIGFTDPAKFRSFERLLDQELHPVTAQTNRSASTGQVLSVPAAPRPADGVAAQPNAASGWHVPGWAWVLGVAGVAWLAWRAVARTFAAASRPALQPSSMSYGTVTGSTAGGYSPNGYAPGYAAPSPGSSALRTGMAVAGGVAAGMALDHLLHRGHDGAASAVDAVEPHRSASSGLAQGMQPGFFDEDNARLAADELQQRDIDFGSGGSWDAGAGDSGGSSDDW